MFCSCKNPLYKVIWTKLHDKVVNKLYCWIILWTKKVYIHVIVVFDMLWHQVDYVTFALIMQLHGRHILCWSIPLQLQQEHASFLFHSVRYSQDSPFCPHLGVLNSHVPCGFQTLKPNSPFIFFEPSYKS